MKSQNKVWVFNDEDTLDTVIKFWSCGILQQVVLDTQKTVTTKWYNEYYLSKVILNANAPVYNPAVAPCVFAGFSVFVIFQWDEGLLNT